ncbi:LysR substrate-binding domain-containing protein [Streptomyces sp. NPDC048489]|uniref:LysR substrate-binding domain-containing protein n=1 Tax=Streptomyces sp. NPDC048489 TaxID=3154504 RepID=UPI00342CA115
MGARRPRTRPPWDCRGWCRAAPYALHQLLRPLSGRVVDGSGERRAVRSTPVDARLHLDELRDESWVTIRAGHAARPRFDQAAAQAGFTPRTRFQTASYDVAQGLGRHRHQRGTGLPPGADPTPGHHPPRTRAALAPPPTPDGGRRVVVPGLGGPLSETLPCSG